MNLKNKSNPGLRSRVLSGELCCETFAVMTPEISLVYFIHFIFQEMASDEFKQEAEKVKKVSLLESQSAQDQQAETDQFKCGKCRSRKCKYFQMQTRSADEPMVFFFHIFMIFCRLHS